MKTYPLISFFMLIGTMLTAQSLNRPESAEYDAKYNRILVSNKGDASNGEKGFIIQMDIDGSNKKEFATPNIDPINALEIVKDTVFANCHDGHVYGFKLSNGEQVIKWKVPLEANGIPNGLTHDENGYLYISDAKNDDVYKVHVDTGTVKKFIEGTGILNINGLYMDTKNKRLFMCGWSNWNVYAADLTTGAVTNHYAGPIEKVDGMASDRCGNYYLSFWKEHKVYKYDSDKFDNPVMLKSASDGLDGPADIGMDRENNNLLIPNLNKNTVTIVNLDNYCSSNNNQVKAENKNTFLYPNPTRNRVQWDDEMHIVKLEFFDLNARLVTEKKNLFGKYSVSLRDLDDGVFIVKGYFINGVILEQKLILTN
ncbi:MAG: SMP-30/gluconolactonase/LRE family protein [Bacteroidales bacterium]|nr:SMP-30/gluconolactonase/LRE family protein [Bacteroidales bacterium]